MKKMVLEMREIRGTDRAKAKLDQLHENAFMPADLGDGVAEKKTSHLAFMSLAPDYRSDRRRENVLYFT